MRIDPQVFCPMQAPGAVEVAQSISSLDGVRQPEPSFRFTRFSFVSVGTEAIFAELGARHVYEG